MKDSEPTVELELTIKDAAGKVQNVNAADIGWTIDDEQIAALSNTHGSSVIVEAKAVGKTKIIVVYQDKQAEISVMITDLRPVTNVSQLKNVSGQETGDLIYVHGYWEADDGGGGLFEYSANSILVSDDGMVITPSNRVGRWLRVVSNNEPVNIRWFGARSDVEQCQGPYIQAAIDYFFKQKKVGTVLIPAGTFNNSYRLGFYEGVSIVGEGIDVSVIKYIGTNSNHNSLFNRTYHYSKERYLRITVSDLTFDVNMYNLGRWIGAIWIEDVFRELTMERVKFDNSGGNIIRLMKNSVIADCIWDDMDGRCLSTGWESKPDLRFRDNIIRDNIFIRTAEKPTDPGINLSRAENNIVTGNQVINVHPAADTYGGIRIPNSSDNNLIQGNTVKNFFRGIWILSGSQNNQVRDNTIIDSWSAALFINNSHEDNRPSSGNTMANNIIIQENPAITKADLIRVQEDHANMNFDNLIEGNEVRITSRYYNTYKSGKTLADGIVWLTGGAERAGKNTVRNNKLVLTD